MRGTKKKPNVCSGGGGDYDYDYDDDDNDDSLYLHKFKILCQQIRCTSILEV